MPGPTGDDIRESILDFTLSYYRRPTSPANRSRVRMKINLGPLHKVMTRSRLAGEDAVDFVREFLFPELAETYKGNVFSIATQYDKVFTGQLARSIKLVSGVVPDKSSPNEFITYGTIAFEAQRPNPNRLNPPWRYWRIYTQSIGEGGVRTNFSPIGPNVKLGKRIYSRLRYWTMRRVGIGGTLGRKFVTMLINRMRETGVERYPILEQAADATIRDPSWRKRVEWLANMLTRLING